MRLLLLSRTVASERGPHARNRTWSPRVPAPAHGAVGSTQPVRQARTYKYTKACHHERKKAGSRNPPLIQDFRRHRRISDVTKPFRLHNVEPQRTYDWLPTNDMHKREKFAPRVFLLPNSVSRDPRRANSRVEWSHTSSRFSTLHPSLQKKEKKCTTSHVSGFPFQPGLSSSFAHGMWGGIMLACTRMYCRELSKPVTKEKSKSKREEGQESERMLEKGTMQKRKKKVVGTARINAGHPKLPESKPRKSSGSEGRPKAMKTEKRYNSHHGDRDSESDPYRSDVTPSLTPAARQT